MTYSVEFSKAAACAFDKLTQVVQRQLQTEINALASQPRQVGCKKLKGSTNRWRARSGDYRIIYEIHDGILLVLIVGVGHRRDIYN